MLNAIFLFWSILWNCGRLLVVDFDQEFGCIIKSALSPMITKMSKLLQDPLQEPNVAPQRFDSCIITSYFLSLARLLLLLVTAF